MVFGAMLQLYAAFLIHYVVSANPNVKLQEAFGTFLFRYGKRYSDKEKAYRLEVFKSNYDFIQAQNAKNGPYKLGINKFADMSDGEIVNTYMGAHIEPKSVFEASSLGRHNYTTGSHLPTDVDWVVKGAVTPVKNQKTCGSCWSFSTTGALEGAWKIVSGELVSLSEQQILDCSGAGDCKGGLVYQAYEWAEKNDVCSEEGYSTYQPQQGTCSSCNNVGLVTGSVVGYKWVDHDMSSLMSAVSQQPVSINVDATGAFTFYQSGILTESCGAYQDHAVLLVGYGTEDGTDYWKVKNSWGDDWGDHGYIRIGRGNGGHQSLKFIKLGGFEPVSSDHPEAPGYLEMSYTDTGKTMNTKPLFAGYYSYSNTQYLLYWKNDGNWSNWVVGSISDVYAYAPANADVTNENAMVTGWSQWNAAASKWDQPDGAGVQAIGIANSTCGVLSHPRYPVMKSNKEVLV